MFRIIRLRILGLPKILTTAIAVCLLLGCLIPKTMGQTALPANPSELYAGIELSIDGIKAIALRISRDEEDPGLKLIYSEVIRFSAGRASTGKFSPQMVTEAAQGIVKLLGLLREQYKVPPERIYLIGSSELGADHPEDLVSTVNVLTGKKLTFLDPVTESQLTIVGTISRRGKVGDAWVDYRDSSVLIEIGSANTKGGYQLLKFSPSTQYDFVTLKLPYGAASFTTEATQAVGESGDWSTLVQQTKVLGAGPLREALRAEREAKPGLLNRKRVYLTGDVAWAIATLFYPEDRKPFVALTTQDIASFASKASRDPYSLLNPNLSRINDRELRQEVEKEFAAIRKAFSLQQIMAGAELLRVISDDLNWQEKNIRFARFGHLACILSYVRVQAGK